MDIHKQYRKALGEFEERVEKELDGDLDAIVIYGSTAREEATPESDIDVLVIGENIEKYKDRISDIRYDVDLEYNTFTTPIYLTPKEFDRKLELGEPLIINILRSGKPLYDNGFFSQRVNSNPKPSREVVEKFYRNGARRLKIAREDLDRDLYDMTVRNSFKAGYLAAESSVMLEGSVPRDKSELINRFQELIKLNELDHRADHLDVDRDDVLKALNLAERVVKSAKAKIYEKEKATPL